MEVNRTLSILFIHIDEVGFLGFSIDRAFRVFRSLETDFTAAVMLFSLLIMTLACVGVRTPCFSLYHVLGFQCEVLYGSKNILESGIYRTDSNPCNVISTLCSRCRIFAV